MEQILSTKCNAQFRMDANSRKLKFLQLHQCLRVLFSCPVSIQIWENSCKVILHYISGYVCILHSLNIAFLIAGLCSTVTLSVKYEFCVSL